MTLVIIVILLTIAVSSLILYAIRTSVGALGSPDAGRRKGRYGSTATGSQFLWFGGSGDSSGSDGGSSGHDGGGHSSGCSSSSCGGGGGGCGGGGGGG